jgi:hypothetical protein
MNIRDPITMVGQIVDSEGLAVVRAVTETELEHTSQINQDAYSYTSVVYDPSAGDTILCVRNDSKTKVLHGVKVIINNGATASSFDVHQILTSFTAAGVTVAATNLNSKGSVGPDITAIADETGNVQGNLIETVFAAADSRTVIDLLGYDFNQDHAIGIDMTEDGAANEVSVTAIVHFGEWTR